MSQFIEGETFKDRAKHTLDKKFMRNAVKKAVDILETRKSKAADELGNWDAWREQGKRIRKHTVDNLDYYLGQLATNVRKNGGNIFFAAQGEDVLAIVQNILKKHKAKHIIKSKSMVSEEIHLNKTLTAQGFDVVETDLAEYILQLCDEPPSHIVVPAIHKSRQDIAELFSQVNGQKLSSDTPTLTAFSRKILRDKFLNADVGITGCNFAIAETGSIALVTNEGNARLVTALPKVHIAIMGMERVLPTFEDLEAILTLLPRSATGQKLTSYISVTNGIKKAGEADGPEHFYLVVLDNGRSTMLADDEFRQALHCTRCGACFNVCPVYRQVGGHAYGSVYGGPIGSVISAFLEKDFKKYSQLAYASTLCAACSKICSVKIPIHDLLFKLRHRYVSEGYGGFTERAVFRLWRAAFQKSDVYNTAMKSAAVIQKPLVNEGFIKWGPPPMSGWTNSRYFPAAADKSFRQRWKDTHKV